MPFKVPKKIELHGYTGSIRVVSKVDDDDNYGEYHPSTSAIRLKEGLSPSDLEWAFWHEAFHFFLDVTGVARNDVGIPEMAEEMLCDAFADFMTKNFKATPKGVK